jgi:hypothetical protein
MNRYKSNLIPEIFFYADIPFGHSCILHCVFCYIWISPWCTRSFGGGLLLKTLPLCYCHATYGVASVQFINLITILDWRYLCNAASCLVNSFAVQDVSVRTNHVV